MPCALLPDPLAVLCSFHGHREEGYLEKLSRVYAPVHLRVCRDKNSRMTSSEKYHPTMLELLGTQSSSGFFQLVVQVLVKPHVDPSLTFFSVSG